MALSVLIRLSGLVAMVGGVASATLGLLYVLQARGATLGSMERALQKGHYENPALMVLLVGVLAAIVALHAIQRRHYGSLGALASLAAFAGIAITVVSNLTGELAPASTAVVIPLLIVGVLAASVGIVGLGIATITAQVLPRWAGMALIAGSPPAVGLEFMFLAVLGAAAILSGEIVWVLAGVPWVLVGYAIFRAESRLSERPSRVR
jgi:hypothetical protein